MHYILQPYNYDLSDSSSIPNLFVAHLTLVLITMLISIAIAVPVGILLTRYRRFYLPTITVSGLLYTIPSIAAFALLIPVTGLSFATVLIPLVLYNQLVLIRNTTTAINGVDPLLLEVGRAMGMTSWELLWRVTLPLALPVIIAGIRIATVTTVGIASLAYLAGQSSLGNLIFQNIVSNDTDAVVAGAILTALFAIVADLLLLALQVSLNRGRSALAVA
ncbi:MAG TPA: glycine/betaine ABC transporter [Ktedonobacter sp.]|nr:glycine/betaine ABC transporter [Ktedonobacter sp.]